MIRVNDFRVEKFLFNGGECNVRLPVGIIGETTQIFAHLYNSDDVMFLLLAVDAVRQINPSTKIDLTIPYFPYARQDRVCNEGEALSVKVMANLINSLECRSVEVYDPHSDVTTALINNCKVKTLADIVREGVLRYFINDRNAVVVCPDAGAAKKIHKVMEYLPERKVVSASKRRNQSTGDILEIGFSENIEGENFIILDDICDGGRTFTALSEKLREAGAERVYLYVTHGIFSNGLETLNNYFDHIFCYFCRLKKYPSDYEKNLTILSEVQHEN